MTMVHGLLKAFIAILILVTAAPAQEVTISGMTHQWHGGNDYSPLPGVRVVVTRNHSVVNTTSSAESEGGEAEYSVQVRGGEPIQVVFHLSKEYVPEMQSLSARAGQSHNLSAALVTIQRYQELQAANPALPPIREKLQCLLHVLPRDSSLFDDVTQMLEQTTTNSVSTVDWERLAEALAAIVVLSFLLERCLALLFEHRTFIQRFNEKGLKEPIAFGLALLVCWHWNFDALRNIIPAGQTSLLGVVITAGVIAGGSKAWSKLFRDRLGVGSTAEFRRLHGMTGTGVAEPTAEPEAEKPE